jgi:glutamine amidotransferase
MIAILSYGLGNIKAFANIYKNLNVPYVIADKAAALSDATKIILPGVGAFDHAMQRLSASGLRGSLEEAVLGRNVPVLGICVGMQMLAESSEEGTEAGLGWVPGVVRKIRIDPGSRIRLLPHMGWNTIAPRDGEPLLTGLDAAQGFYFLHSYQFCPHDDQQVIARADYASEFACAVRRDHIAGVQFHPEKSHHNGVRLLRNFAEA